MKILKNNNRKNRVIIKLQERITELLIEARNNAWVHKHISEQNVNNLAERIKLNQENIELKKIKEKYETLLKEIDINEDLIRITRKRNTNK